MVTRLPKCFHSFHTGTDTAPIQLSSQLTGVCSPQSCAADCLDPWLKQNGTRAQCPVCKTPVFEEADEEQQQQQPAPQQWPRQRPPLGLLPQPWR